MDFTTFSSYKIDTKFKPSRKKNVENAGEKLQDAGKAVGELIPLINFLDFHGV